MYQTPWTSVLMNFTLCLNVFDKTMTKCKANVLLPQKLKSRIKSEKWVKVKVLLAQLCLTLSDPMDCSPPGSVHRILLARTLEWIAIPFSRGSSHPGIKPGSPSLQADSLLSEPPGKPRIRSRWSERLLFIWINYSITSECLIIQKCCHGVLKLKLLEGHNHIAF